LIESCLKRAGINLKEELALLDEGAFLISLLQQIAGDLSSDVRVFQPVECARHWPRLIRMQPLKTGLLLWLCIET